MLRFPGKKIGKMLDFQGFTEEKPYRPRGVNFHCVKKLWISKFNTEIFIDIHQQKV